MKSNHAKMKQLFHLKNVIVIVTANIIFALTVFHNHYGKGFLDLAQLLNFTLVNLLLFVPICVFLICLLWNDMAAYRLRFASKSKWLHNESKWIVTVLSGYTLCHVCAAYLSAILAGLIQCSHVAVTRSIVYGMIFYAISQYLFVLTIFFIMCNLYLSFLPEMNQCGFIAVIITACLYIAEILTSRNGLITPALLTDCTLLEHLILIIPRFLLLLLSLAVCRHIQKGRRLYVS